MGQNIDLYYNPGKELSYLDSKESYVAIDLNRFKNLLQHCYNQARKPESFQQFKDKNEPIEVYNSTLIQKGQEAKNCSNVLTVLKCWAVGIPEKDFKELQLKPPIEQFTKLADCINAQIKTYNPKQLALAQHRIKEQYLER